ncbi:hypothetical protein ACH5A2_18290 [Streptomyces collinus]|uniref:hypothetical protein n=1 Tax=Streptomyces collinus TaxID=42684 RepID=UPI0037981B51
MIMLTSPHRESTLDAEWIKGLPDLLRGKREPTRKDAIKALDLIGEARQWLCEFLPLRPDVIDEMTYEATMSYFVEDRPEDPRVAKGALLLGRHREGALFMQIFLDEADEVVTNPDGKPYGRQVIVRHMDAELKDLFSGKKLVIVE